MRRVTADFSGISLTLGGLPPALAERLAEDWAPFLAEHRASAHLEAEVVAGSGPPEPALFQPKAMRAELAAAGARFSLAQGEARVAPDGRVRIELRPAEGATPYFALLNLLRASLAWWLPRVEAGLVHAAGLVVRGRAFLLVGPAGSGKTTWARLGRQGGALVLSDDLVLVSARDARLEALGAPFRSTEAGTTGPGRYPLAALLFPRHGRPAALSRQVPGLVARARLTANLPFVSEGLAHDAQLAVLVERLATAAPCRELTFDLDPSFLALLEERGAADG